MGFDGLQWQRIDLPWAGGIGAKDHPYRQALPKASAMVNFRFQKSGALVARPSVRDYGLPTNPAMVVESSARMGRSLVLLGDVGAARLDDLPPGESDESLDGEWRALKTPGPRAVRPRRRPIVRNEDGCRVVFTCAQNGRLVHVWSKTTSDAPEVWFLVEDAESGAVIRGPEIVVGLLGYDGGPSPASAADRDGVQAVAHAASVGGGRFVSIFGCDAVTPTLAASVTIYIPPPSAEAVAEVSLGAVATHAGVDAQSLIVTGLQGLVDVYGVAGTTRVHRFVHTGSLAAPQLLLQSTGIVTGLGTPIGICRGPSYITALGYAGSDLVYNAQPVGPLSNGVATSFYTLDATDPPPRAAVGVGGEDGAFFVDCGSSIAPAATYGSTPANTACLRLVRVDDAGECSTSLEWRVWHVCTYAWPWPSSDLDADFVTDPGKAVCPVVAPLTTDDVLLDSDNAGVFRRAGTLLEWDVATTNDVQGPPVVRRIGIFGLDLSRPMETRRKSHSYLRAPGATDGSRFFGGISDTVVSGLRGYLTPGATPSFQADCFEIEDGKATWHGEVNGLHIAGTGIVSCVDDVRHAEVMQMPPPVLRIESVTRLTNVNFPTYYPLGDWSIRACWMWRDAKGIVHRSAPSPPITIATTVPQAPDDPFLDNVVGLRAAVPPFAEWRQDENRFAFPTDIFLEVYTSPGGVRPTASAPPIATDGLYFRQRVYDSIGFTGAPTSPIPDNLVNGRELTRLVPAIDPTEPGWTVPIYTMGGVYSDNNTLELYTNGGILENDPPPCPVHMAATRSRLWLIDAEDPYRVLPSKRIAPGKIPEWNQALDLRVPTDTGELVALGAIDDLVIIFSREAIYALDTADAGPDDAGDGAFPPLRLVSRERGCVNARGVITADVGCFFPSDGGIYLLQANGQLEWVSRDLGDDIDFSRIVGASIDTARKEVVFALATGCYVFDYDHGQWSGFAFNDDALISPSVGSIVDLATTSEGLAFTLEDGRTFIEKIPDTGFSERVVYSVSTGWLALAGLLGFQRVRRVHLLGRFLLTATPSVESLPDLGTFTITAHYNFKDSDIQQYVLTSDDLLAIYNEGKHDPLRLSMHLKRQRCQSIKLTFTYTPGAEQNAIPIRPELVALGFEVGFKPRSRTEQHFFGGGVTLP